MAANETAQDAYLIIPAYNPTAAFGAFLRELTPSWNGPIVVVDDGSTAEAQPLFEQAKAQGCTVLAHPHNRGKGVALRTAFAWCLDHAPEGFAGAVTADADGQHLVSDILATRDALLAQPNNLILGCRDFSAEDVPARSKTGNRTMCLAMRAFFGMRLSDTQTGLRGIPAAFMRDLLAVPGDTYVFETNMLIEAHNTGVAITEIPITTVYENDNESSHFNPLLDSLRVAAVFVRYALSSTASSIVDLVAFALLSPVFAAAGLGALTIAAATCAARIISGVANFLINRHLVFKRGDSRRGAVRYAALWLGCMCASAALVTVVSALIPFVPSAIIKMVVDVALFFVNYRIQESWVFATDKQTANESKEG